MPNEDPTRPSVVSEPLTVGSVLLALKNLTDNDPAMLDRPVHILDMHADEDGPEQPWDGLVTKVETDCFQQEQGLVVSLLAWRGEAEFMARRERQS